MAKLTITFLERRKREVIITELVINFVRATVSAWNERSPESTLCNFYRSRVFFFLRVGKMYRSGRVVTVRVARDKECESEMARLKNIDDTLNEGLQVWHTLGIIVFLAANSLAPSRMGGDVAFKAGIAPAFLWGNMDCIIAFIAGS